MNRAIRRALGHLETLPPDLLADAIERLIDRLDELDAPTYDLEAGSDDDACEVEDAADLARLLPVVGDDNDDECDDWNEDDDPAEEDDAAEDDDPGGTKCEDEGQQQPLILRTADRLSSS